MPGPRPRWRPSLWPAAVLLLAASTASAAKEAPLPQPLTLRQALAIASNEHPVLARSQARLDASIAERAAARARDGAQLWATLEGRLIEPSADDDHLSDSSPNDSRASLVLSKRLYDFGRTEHTVEAARAEAEGRFLHHLDNRQQFRIQVMRRFFDVLLADLAYARDNEAMAIAYIDLDEARDRNELDQISDIDLLEEEDRYQELRVHRYRSQRRQRAARARLAQALSRPGQLPADLADPALPGIDRELPAYEDLLQSALDHNARLQALRRRLEGAREGIAAARAGYHPVLRGEVEANAWNRQLGSRERFAAGVTLDVPLSQGGRVDAEVARARAEMRELAADLRAYRYDLRQAVLETWQEIQALQAQQEYARIKTDYRDLYLTRSRARYELELETDFGDALVRQTEARLLRTRTRLEMALAWARLAALTNRPELDPLRGPPAPEDAD